MLIAAQLALALDGRLVFEKDFTHLWELPREYNVARGYGANRKQFDYEKNGRSDESYGQWIEKLKESKSFAETFDDTVVDSDICGPDCGMDQKLITKGQCLTEVLTTFGKCIDHIHDNSLNMPIYYHVFKKPTKLMID